VSECWEYETPCSRCGIGLIQLLLLLVPSASATFSSSGYKECHCRSTCNSSALLIHSVSSTGATEENGDFLSCQQHSATCKKIIAMFFYTVVQILGSIKVGIGPFLIRDGRRGGVAECEPCLSFSCPIPGSRGRGFIEVQLVA
jgi:hypothetical protein